MSGHEADPRSSDSHSNSINGSIDTGQRVRFDLALPRPEQQEDQLRALGYLE